MARDAIVDSWDTRPAHMFLFSHRRGTSTDQLITAHQLVNTRTAKRVTAWKCLRNVHRREANDARTICTQALLTFHCNGNTPSSSDANERCKPYITAVIVAIALRQ